MAGNTSVFPGSYWKGLIGALGAVVLVANTLLGADAFGPEVAKWLNIVVAVGTALGVYLKANITGAGDDAAPEP